MSPLRRPWAVALFVALLAWGCEFVAYDVLAGGRGLPDAGGGKDRPGGDVDDGGEDPSDECPLECGPNGRCSEDEPPRCDCDEGYEDLGEVCANINECTRGLHDCLEEARCTDHPGGFECRCPEGYEGDGRTSCTDVDECATANGGCHADAECTNTEGSRTCACRDGFEPAGELANGTPNCVPFRWPRVAHLPVPIDEPRALVHEDRLYVSGLAGGTPRLFVGEFDEQGKLGEFTDVPLPSRIECMKVMEGRFWYVHTRTSPAVLSAPLTEGAFGAWLTVPIPGSDVRQGCVIEEGRIYLLGADMVVNNHSAKPVRIGEAGADGSVSWSDGPSLGEFRFEPLGTMFRGRLYAFNGGYRNAHGGEWTVSNYEYARVNGDGTLGAWSKESGSVFRLADSPRTDGLVTFDTSRRVSLTKFFSDGAIQSSEVLLEPSMQRPGNGALVIHDGRALVIGQWKQTSDEIWREALP